MMIQKLAGILLAFFAATAVWADSPYALWITPKGDDPTAISQPISIKPDGIVELTVWYRAPDADPDPSINYGLIGLEVCLGWDTSTSMGTAATPRNRRLALDGTLSQALTVYQTGPGGNALCGFRAASGSASDSERPYGLQFSHASLSGFPASDAQKLFDIKLRNLSLQPGDSQQVVIWDAATGVSYTSYLAAVQNQVIRLGTSSITVRCDSNENSISGKVNIGVPGRQGLLRLYKQGSQQPDASITVQPDALGSFTVKTTLSGTYSLQFVWANHVSRCLKGITIVPDTVLPAEITLPNGDADNDGQVNLFDIVELDKNFGSSTSPADLDGDGHINLFDYVVIDQNFGAQSDSL